VIKEGGGRSENEVALFVLNKEEVGVDIETKQVHTLGHSVFL